MNNLNVAIGQYVKGDSFLHKLDPRFKIVSTILLMVAIFLIPSSLTNTYYLLGFLGLFLLILLISKINIVAVLKGLRPIVFIGIFTFILQLVYVDKSSSTLLFNLNFGFSWLSILLSVLIFTVWLFTKKYIPFKLLYLIMMLGGILACLLFVGKSISFYDFDFGVYSEGLIRGVFFLLRIVLVVFLSTLLTISTSTIEINMGLEWVLSPFKLIKLPVAEISMMFSLTLRFIPTLMIETSKIMKAQASRGIDFNEGTFIEKVKQIVTLLIPMFFISITRAEDLANAMEARGYVIGERRTNVDELKFRLKDLISFIVVLSILGFTIYLQVAK